MVPQVWGQLMQKHFINWIELLPQTVELFVAVIQFS